jgi:hypothetical protein
MDYDHLRQYLLELNDAEQARVIARVAELVYQFSRVLTHNAKEHPHGDPWKPATTGFIGKLADAIAVEHLPYCPSPRELWGVYLERIAPFAVWAALESGLVPESQAAELQIGLNWFRGAVLSTSDLSQDGLPIGACVGNVLDDRWHYWEARLLKRTAEKADSQVQAGSAQPQIQIVPNGTHSRRKTGPSKGLAVDAARFRALRGSHTTQEGFAEVCAVSVATIQRAEAGGRVGPKTLESIIQRSDKKFKRHSNLADILATSKLPQN